MTIHAILLFDMKREILQIGNKILNKPSEEIKQSEIGSDELNELIKDMIDSLQSYGNKAAGLSAVQIGVLKRICVCRRVDLEEDGFEPLWEVMINPQIEIIDSTESLVWEGCLSIGEGEDQLWGPVYRAKRVKVSFTTPSGTNKQISVGGFMSHLVQHEVDHLNGKLFLQYVKNPKNIWKNKELDKYLSKNSEFPQIID